MIDQSDGDVYQVNDTKTKEMIFGSDVTIVAMPPLASLNTEQIEREKHLRQDICEEATVLTPASDNDEFGHQKTIVPLEKEEIN